MLGVCINSVPIRQLMASANCWSVMTSRVLGTSSDGRSAPRAIDAAANAPPAAAPIVFRNSRLFIAVPCVRTISILVMNQCYSDRPCDHYTDARERINNPPLKGLREVWYSRRGFRTVSEVVSAPPVVRRFMALKTFIDTRGGAFGLSFQPQQISGTSGSFCFLRREAS